MSSNIYIIKFLHNVLPWSAVFWTSPSKHPSSKSECHPASLTKSIETTLPCNRNLSASNCWCCTHYNSRESNNMEFPVLGRSLTLSWMLISNNSLLLHSCFGLDCRLGDSRSEQPYLASRTAKQKARSAASGSIRCQTAEELMTPRATSSFTVSETIIMYTNWDVMANFNTSSITVAVLQQKCYHATTFL